MNKYVIFFGALLIAAAGIIYTTRMLDTRTYNEALEEVNLTLNTQAFDPVEGKRLFVNKGCVICHSVNGVGGTAATALNAPDRLERVDMMEFGARMWHGAPAMIALQRIELGYDIQFTGAELAALVAFGSDRETQRTFSLDDVPEPVQDWFLNDIYFQDENWASDLLQDEWPDYTTEPPEEAETPEEQ